MNPDEWVWKNVKHDTMRVIQAVASEVQGDHG
jgi:hypothetical protein